MPNSNFEVCLANDTWGRQIHYRLRYQVFCLETGYEDPCLYPDQEEKDEWDDNSAHLLVREKNSGQWVATMRVVLPETQILPIQKRVPIESSLRRHKTECAEISRLCIVGHHRRRIQARARSCGNMLSGRHGRDQVTRQAEAKKQQRTVEILQSLLNAAVAISAERGIEYWYMLTTRGLAKVLEHALPMKLQLAGPSCWHRGERYPFLVDIRHLTDGVAELWRQGHAYRLHSDVLLPMPRAVGAD